ncbi:MAG: hypothetical protein KDA72_15665 [Planctomycetales bacterium]|nr:hypothetical protein [Planctomycetales bacterium]
MNAPDFISMAEQMQRVLAFRRQQAHAMSTSARLELLATLQQQAFNSMHSNPAAVEAFVRRNHHQRRLSNVRRLEAEMRRCVEEPNA